MAERGKCGKFIEKTMESGRNKKLKKWKNYTRKPVRGSSRKGRRDYPWRKRKRDHGRRLN